MLIWVFAGRTNLIVGFVVRWLKWLIPCFRRHVVALIILYADSEGLDQPPQMRTLIWANAVHIRPGGRFAHDTLQINSNSNWLRKSKPIASLVNIIYRQSNQFSLNVRKCTFGHVRPAKIQIRLRIRSLIKIITRRILNSRGCNVFHADN